MVRVAAPIQKCGAGARSILGIRAAALITKATQAAQINRPLPLPTWSHGQRIQISHETLELRFLLPPLSHRSDRSGQARPGPAGREIQRESAASRSSSPLQKRLEASGREPAAARRRGGDARGQWRRWRPPPTLCSPPRAAPSPALSPSPYRSR